MGMGKVGMCLGRGGKGKATGQTRDLKHLAGISLWATTALILANKGHRLSAAVRWFPVNSPD
jgi:hypothetical protein